MRDLYCQLKLTGQERNVMAIRSAISQCHDPEVAAAATHILLSPKRKAIYDRNWRVMHKISQLRINLRLNTTTHWRHIDPAAFESHETSAPSSELANLRRKLNEKPGKDGPRLQV